MPINICMFSNLYPPVVSGSATQSSCLARELCRRGHNVTVVTARVSESSPVYEVDGGVHVYRLPAVRLPRMGIALNFPWISLTFTPANVNRIKDIIERHGIDVFHLHNHMFDMSLSAVRMKHIFGKPLVVTIHTVIKHSKALYNALLLPTDRLLLKSLVINHADAIISPDANIENYVLDAFRISHSHLVPYGITLPDTISDSLVEQARNKYDLNGKRVILSLGHVHDIRDRRDIIEALPSVLKIYPNTVLLIAGAVSSDSPAKLAGKLGIRDSVIFTDHVPHLEVPALLGLADLEAHWLNQDIPEKTSLGIASLEAMWAGKTVLAAANELTYGPGVLKNGENIVLVNPGSPSELGQIITELLGDKEKRNEIGRKARETVERHFSWDSVCAETVDVYCTAIHRQAHR